VETVKPRRRQRQPPTPTAAELHARGPVYAFGYLRDLARRNARIWRRLMIFYLVGAMLSVVFLISWYRVLVMTMWLLQITFGGRMWGHWEAHAEHADAEARHAEDEIVRREMGDAD
jgi:hypothetical protein